MAGLTREQPATDPPNEVREQLDRGSDKRRRELRESVEKGIDPAVFEGKSERQRLEVAIQILEKSAALGSEGAASRAAQLRLALRRSRASEGKQGTTLQLSDSVSYLPPEVGEAVLIAVGVDAGEAHRISRAAHRREVAEAEDHKG